MPELSLVQTDVTVNSSIERQIAMIGRSLAHFNGVESSRCHKRLQELDALLIRNAFTLEFDDDVCIRANEFPYSKIMFFRKWTRRPTRIAQAVIETGLVIANGAAVYFCLRSGNSGHLTLKIGYEARQDEWSYQLETMFDRRHENGFANILRNEAIPYGKHVITSERFEMLFSRILIRI